MTYLLPSECLDGTAAERVHLRRLLVSFRTDPPPMRLPDVSGCPLLERLDSGTIDSQVFWTGYGIMAYRYAQLGIRALLPLERVWVGTNSAAVPGTACAYGGFHHPGQRYRHLQMDAAITVYGDLTWQLTASPQAIAVDQVRSYACPILTTGATPVIVDVAEGAVGLDPVDVARKLTTRTVAALSLPLWGYPAGSPLPASPRRRWDTRRRGRCPGPRHARRRPSCGNPRNRRVLLHPRPQTAFHRRRRAHPHRRRHPGGEGRELHPAGPPHRPAAWRQLQARCAARRDRAAPPAQAGGADHGPHR